MRPQGYSPPPPRTPRHGTWDRMGYSRKAAGTHPMHKAFHTGRLPTLISIGLYTTLKFKLCSDLAKTKIFFDVCHLFFDLFRFRFHFRMVLTVKKLESESSSVTKPLSSILKMFLRFVSEFKGVAWLCSHAVLKRSEVTLMKTLTLMPSVNKLVPNIFLITRTCTHIIIL